MIYGYYGKDAGTVFIIPDRATELTQFRKTVLNMYSAKPTLNYATVLTVLKAGIFH